MLRVLEGWGDLMHLKSNVGFEPLDFLGVCQCSEMIAGACCFLMVNVNHLLLWLQLFCIFLNFGGTGCHQRFALQKEKSYTFACLTHDWSGCTGDFLINQHYSNSVFLFFVFGVCVLLAYIWSPGLELLGHWRIFLSTSEKVSVIIFFLLLFMMVQKQYLHFLSEQMERSH